MTLFGNDTCSSVSQLSLLVGTEWLPAQLMLDLPLIQPCTFLGLGHFAHPCSVYVSNSLISC